jgi:hypothetical protein
MILCHSGRALASCRRQSCGEQRRGKRITKKIQTVAGGFSIQAPDAILQETKAKGSFGYNEIVVLGTGPTGTEIRPIGIFMKLDTAGNRYARPNDTAMGWKNETAFVTDDIVPLFRGR